MVDVALCEGFEIHILLLFHCCRLLDQRGPVIVRSVTSVCCVSTTTAREPSSSTPPHLPSLQRVELIAHVLFARWVNNCISGSNHKYFFGFVLSLFLNLVLGIVVGYDGVQKISDSQTYYFVCFCIVLAVLTTLPVASLTFTHLFKVNQNVTTNELINCKRHKENDPKRYPWIDLVPLYRNKYDLGLLWNWVDFLDGWRRSMPRSYDEAYGQTV